MIAVYFLLAGGFLFLVSRLYQTRWRKGLSVSIHFEQGSVYAGRQVVLEEVIENRKKLPLPILEIGFRVEKGLSFVDAPNIQTSDFVYKRDIFSLLGWEQIRRKYVLDCQKRGCYHATQLSLVTYSFFGRFRYVSESTSDARLYVYPRRVDLSKIRPSLETILGEVSSSKRLYEDPFSFSGIRPYVPTDPMKTINWKASAKTQSLQVNTFTSTQNTKAILYLDVFDPFIIKKDDLVEEAISIASTIAGQLVQAGMEVGIYVNAWQEREPNQEPEKAKAPLGRRTTPDGQSYFALSPSRSREHLARMDEFLTSDFTKGCMDYGQMLKEIGRGENPTKRTIDPTAVHLFLSMNQDPAILTAILTYLGRQSKGLWIVPLKRGDTLALRGQPGLGILPHLIR